MLSLRRHLVVSRIAAVVLALISSYFCLSAVFTIMWTPSGDFGITIDDATGVVTDLDPRQSAKGIHVGDRIDLAAMPFLARGYLYQDALLKPYPAHMTIPFVHDGRKRTVTLETDHLVSMPFLEDTYIWVRRIVGMIFIVTGVIVVWNRPSVMLWGLAVLLIGTHAYIIGPLTSPALAALEI